MTPRARTLMALKVLFEGYNRRSWTDQDRSEVEKLMAANPWMAGDNVTGFSVGEETRDGHKTGDIALRICVRKKMPLDSLAQADRIPSALTLPPPIGTVDLDVIESGPLKLSSAVSGAGIACVNTKWPDNAGTIGALFYEETRQGADMPVILSCAHVFGYSERGLRFNDTITQTHNGTVVGKHIKQIRFGRTHKGERVLYDATTAAADVNKLHVDVPGKVVPIHGFGRRPNNGVYLYRQGAKTSGTAVVNDKYRTLRVKAGGRYKGIPANEWINLPGQVILDGNSVAGDSGGGYFGENRQGGRLFYGIHIGDLDDGGSSIVMCPFALFRSRLRLKPL